MVKIQLVGGMAVSSLAAPATVCYEVVINYRYATKPFLIML